MLPACALSGAAERHRGRMDVLVRFQDARRHYNTSACGPQPSLAKQQTMSLFTSCQNTSRLPTRPSLRSAYRFALGNQGDLFAPGATVFFLSKRKTEMSGPKDKKRGHNSHRSNEEKETCHYKGWGCRPYRREKLLTSARTGLHKTRMTNLPRRFGLCTFRLIYHV